MEKLGRHSIRPAIRQGGVYFVTDVPPLDGDREKDRWVVVVDDNESLKAGADPVVVVCCSASVTEAESDRVALPNKADTPNCKTGLPRPCWAVPRWRVPIARPRLNDRRGEIRGRALREVLTNYLTRFGG